MKIGEKCIKLHNMSRIYDWKIPVVFFYLFAFLSFVLTLFSNVFVPSQFTRDSEFYVARIQSSVTGSTDSYQFVANFYRFFGITENNLELRIFEWLLFFTIIALALNSTNVRYLDFFSFITSLVYLTLIPFYGSVLTKETFIALALAPYLIIKKRSSKRLDFISLIVILVLIATLLRNYYFITFAFFIFYYIFDKKIKSVPIRFISPVILLSFLATLDSRYGFFRSLLGEDIFNIRLKIQSGLKIAANSKIDQQFVSQSIFENTLSYSSVWFQMVIPLKLLQPSIYSLVTLIVVSYVSISFIFPFIKAKPITEVDVFFLIAYFSVALIFEPDLGSYVRHSFPFLVLVVRNSRIQSKIR